MADFRQLSLSFVSAKQAAAVCRRWHYMKTYPSGARVNLALVDAEGLVQGIAVFGYSTATAAKVKGLGVELPQPSYLEMQRLWVSDDYGHNAESWLLARIMRQLRDTYDLQLVVTHAGGCKDDCGIVYQASGWLYFGASVCEDFYLTAAGQYKNVIAALRFGRISSKGKSKQEVGEQLFGPGEVVHAHRYLYAYPISKALRRRLAKRTKPFPKQSARFRRDQQWVDGEPAGAEPGL